MTKPYTEKKNGPMKKLLITVINLSIFISLFSQTQVSDKRSAVEAQILYNNAVEQIALNRYFEAEKLLDDALLLKSDYLEAAILSARTNIALENLNKAFERVALAESVNPENGEVDYLKGFLAYHTDSSFHDSLLFLNAIAEGYIEAPVYYYLGVLKVQDSSYMQAVIYFGKAIDLKNDYALAYHDLASALMFSGKTEEAIYNYKYAVFYNPEFSQAWSNLAQARVVSGDLQGALADYNTAVKMDTANYSALNNRGVIKLDLGDIEGAEMDFMKALAIKPEFSKASVNLANALAKNKDYEGAVNILDTVIEKNPRMAEAYLNRGLALESIGKLSEACADWNKVKELGFDTADKFLKDCK